MPPKKKKCKIPKCFFSMGSLGRFFLCMDFFNPKIFFGAWKKSILGFFCPKMGPIILHHMMPYDGGSHHMMGGGHHMMHFSHHMMGGPIIFHHMMPYDGSLFFRFFGNCCSHFQISKVFVAAACFRQWERP